MSEIARRRSRANDQGRTTVTMVVLIGATLAVGLIAIAIVTGAPETAIDALDPSVRDSSWFVIVADRVGSLPVVAIAVAFIAVASRSSRAAALVVVAAVLAECLTAGIKVLVDRPRPPLIATVEVFGTASFPSGLVVRTAVAVGLALVVVPWARRRPILALGLGLIIVIGMAIGRVAGGAHHTSDVVAAMLVAAGLLAALAWCGLTDAIPARRW